MIPEMRDMEYFSKPSLYRPGLLNAQEMLEVTKNSGTTTMKKAQRTQQTRPIYSPLSPLVYAQTSCLTVKPNLAPAGL